MRWVSWGLTMVMTAVPVVWLSMLWRMWALRYDFEIAARNPALECLTSFTRCKIRRYKLKNLKERTYNMYQIYRLVLAMSVLLHWLLLTMGKSLPCWVVFWVSCSTYPFAIYPYFIRVLRLVVGYNKRYRGKYARFVKRKTVVGYWTAATVGYVIRSALFYGQKPEHFSSDARDCYYWDDTTNLAFMILCGGVPMLLLARKLRRVIDSFKIREEIERVVGICFICAGTVATIQVLIMLEIVQDSRRLHVVGEVMVLLWAINVGFWGLLVPLASYSKCHGRVMKVLVVPMEENQTAYTTDGVLDLASKYGEATERFEQFCRENLCLESWFFTVDTVLYQRAPTNDPDEQFDAFLCILDQYLLGTSPHEINISSQMRKHMASFKTREAFGNLDDDARRYILKEPLDEIVRVLEQNLLHKFRARTTRQTGAQLTQDSKGDTDPVDLSKTSFRLDSWRGF